MKKITLSLLTVLFTGTLMAQLPANEFFRYEFTNGSLANTANTAATDLTGSFTSIADRNNSAGDAADITGLMNGANLGSTNINNSTLSFWIKTPTITSPGNKRVLQMYGTGGNGYRIEIDGTNLYINAMAESLSGFLGDAASDAVNIDDNQWHNIIVKTEYVGNASIDFDVYVDGVALPNASALSIDPPGSTVNTFLKNATFTIDPLNGTYTGSIDDIYVYKSALNNAEITQLYNYYPVPPPTRYYVDIDATGNNDGSSWADAFTDVRDAFNNSFNGMEIWVADGVYIRQNTTDRNSVFGWTTDSLKVYGGFNGTETMLSQRDWRVNETILSGDIGTAGNNSDNCYTTLVGPIGSASNIINYSLIDGFTVQDGNANGTGSFNRERGGGFYSWEYVNKTDIKNCTFRDNSAVYGGAVTAYAAAVNKTINFESCIFQENSHTYGTVDIQGLNGLDITSTISNCLFSDNTASSPSAGGNQMTSLYFGIGSGGDIDANVVNSTFTNNSNSYTGTNDVSSILVYAVGTSGVRNVTIDNSIFWGNTNDTELVGERDSGFGTYSSVNINNSISNLTSSLSFYSETNVINQDPLFSNPSSADYTLQNGSPAINAGSQTGLTIPTLDLAGNPRVAGTEIDLGCYEKPCPQFTFQITESNGVLSAPTNLVSYQWSFDGNDIAGATSATYTPTQSGLYTVEVSDGNCPKTQTYFFCSTALLTLFENNGVLTAPSGFDGYEWFLDGVLIAGANNAVYATTQDGSYYCEAILFAGPDNCTQTTATVSICSSVSVDITESNGTLTATPGYSDYQWFKDGVAISGAQNDTYTATESGDYFCEATENGCTSSSNMITIDLGTGINDIAFTRVNIYPNPTNGVFTISSSESIELVEVFNHVGQKVADFGHVNTIDISNLSNGVYTIKATSNAKIGVARLIKQ